MLICNSRECFCNLGVLLLVRVVVDEEAFVFLHLGKLFSFDLYSLLEFVIHLSFGAFVAQIDLTEQPMVVGVQLSNNCFE